MITLVDMPKIDEMLAFLFDSKSVISLDLRNGYYHIKHSPERRYKSAFTTIFGKYKFLRMPFRLVQGSAQFTAMMQKVFGECKKCLFLPMALLTVTMYNIQKQFFKISEM